MFLGTPHKLPKDSTELRASFEKAIITLIEQGVVFFGSGAALGFDQLAAETVLKMKEDYPHIRLVIVLPCPPEQQSLKWNDEQKNGTTEYLIKRTRFGFCRRSTQAIVCLTATDTWWTIVHILSAICGNIAAERSTQ